MDPNTLANIRTLFVVVIALFISLRAFYIYGNARSPRLFILALSMLIIVLTTTLDTMGDNFKNLHLNSYWYNYFGQDTTFFFIILSLSRSKNTYLQQLMRWQVMISLLLLVLVILGPTFPTTFPSLGVIRAILSSSRGIFCLIIFCFYFSAFVSKESRFSLLMAGAFLLLGVGYIVGFPRYILPHQDLLQTTGDIIRILGFSTLLTAVLSG